MKTYLKIIVSIGMFFVLVSCDSFTEFVSPKNLPKIEKDFVATCFVSPADQAVVVKVNRFSDVLGQVQKLGSSYSNLDRVILDATVTITNKKNNVVLSVPFNSKLFYYYVPLQGTFFEAGTTYELKIVEKNGTIHKAETTIPDKLVVDLSVQSAETLNKSGNLKSFPISWISPPGTYQRLTSYSTYYYKNLQTGNFDQNTYSNNSSDYFENTENTIEDNFVRYKVYLQKSNSNDVNNYYLNFISLLNVDEAYYKYHKSVEKNLQNNDNPFAEPTIIIGNISDGYGCFDLLIPEFLL